MNTQQFDFIKIYGGRLNHPLLDAHGIDIFTNDKEIANQIVDEIKKNFIIIGSANPYSGEYQISLDIKRYNGPPRVQIDHEAFNQLFIYLLSQGWEPLEFSGEKAILKKRKEV